MRKAQRDATRTQIVKAALSCIAERGYDAVTTRYIASVADVSQGLLTYHFKTKEILWRAAAEHLFEILDESLGLDILEFNAHDAKKQTVAERDEMQRDCIRRIVRFHAKHPELLRFMLQKGSDNDSRTEWLVDTHIKPSLKQFSTVMSHIPEKDLPHMLYALSGASGIIFSVPDECERATGMNPRLTSAIERHADYLAYLFIPERN